MFENIPARLEAATRATFKYSENQNYRDVAAAGLVIAEYLRMMPTGVESDKFFDFKEKDGGGNKYDHSVRLISIAECLFLLRSTGGFPEICRRFKERDFRSTFFELFAARVFFDAGFDIQARPEVGMKGADFDFSAVAGSVKINVEVTALTAEPYSPATFKNALEKKRAQLPAGHPAIIVCTHPESWFGTPELDFSLMATTYRFLTGTRRINAVLIFGEQHMTDATDPKFGALFFTQVAHLNVSPRHPTPLGFLFPHRPDTPRSINLTNAAGVPLMEAMPPYRQSEFFRWVDYLTTGGGQ